MISKAMRLARVGSGSELAAALLVALGFPCIMLAAIIPNLWFFAAATAVTYLADRYLHHCGSYLINRLAAVRAGLSIRFLVRQLLLILLLSRMGYGEETLFYVTVACLLAFYGLQAPQSAMVTLIRLRRKLPVVTRNIDLERVRIPDAPPTLLMNRPAEKMLHLDVFAIVGVLIAAETGVYGIAYAGLALTLVLALGYLLLLLPYIRPKRLVASADTMLSAVDTWLREYRPTVVLYFSGSKESAYQANMWLETMAQLGGRPMILLRERNILPQLATTSVPVLCVPGGVHLMNLDLSSVRVALYAANVGKNIHLLRVPTMKHVFIGHGDSDKIASVNPYSKVYDEVWTAGRAGRDRYALADVGVRDEDIVEVGRPQLAAIRSWSGTQNNPIPTVLYAPTWEGWDDNPGNTSLLLAGENIVRRLLEAEQPVRLLYKPHPFTGTRSARAKAVHLRITAMIEQAAARRATDPAGPSSRPRSRASRPRHGPSWPVSRHGWPSWPAAGAPRGTRRSCPATRWPTRRARPRRRGSRTSGTRRPGVRRAGGSTGSSPAPRCGCTTASTSRTPWSRTSPAWCPTSSRAASRTRSRTRPNWARTSSVGRTPRCAPR